MTGNDDWSLSATEKKRILRERARLLAQAPGEERGGSYLEIIEFSLAHEHYGLESRYIRAVYPLKSLVPLPGVPSFILGIINLRGEIISLVDLKRFFRLPDRGLTDLNRVLVLCHKDMEFGILADELIGAKMVSAEKLQTSLPLASEALGKYLKGITEDGLIILDGEKILSDAGMIVDKK